MDGSGAGAGSRAQGSKRVGMKVMADHDVVAGRSSTGRAWVVMRISLSKHTRTLTIVARRVRSWRDTYQLCSLFIILNENACYRNVNELLLQLISLNAHGCNCLCIVILCKMQPLDD